LGKGKLTGYSARRGLGQSGAGRLYAASIADRKDPRRKGKTSEQRPLFKEKKTPVKKIKSNSINVTVCGITMIISTKAQNIPA